MAWTEADDVRIREHCKMVDVGKLTQCPKCAMGSAGSSELMLTHFCQHRYCPFREYSAQKAEAERQADPYHVALARWKAEGGDRPAKRPDGIPTRLDANWMTRPEDAVLKAQEAVEQAGASPALTDAVVLLQKARERVADHIEGRGSEEAKG